MKSCVGLRSSAQPVDRMSVRRAGSLVVMICGCLASIVEAQTFPSNSGAITHRYLPIEVGAVFTYTGYGEADGLSFTYRALGLETVDGKQALKCQATGDESWTVWLAQDDGGTVWQLRSVSAEGTDEYDTVYLPGTLTAAQQYRYEGRWFEVLSITAATTTPAGNFPSCIRAREMYDYDDPREELYYASGYGIVRIVYPDLGATGFQLTSISGHTVPPVSRFLLSGTVRLDSATGSGMAGVGVMLIPFISWDAETAADGSYAFANIAAGSYRVIASRSGYTFDPANPTVVINADTANVNFVARLAGTPEFLAHPQDAAAVAGQGVEFTIEANGSPIPTLRWQRRPADAATWTDLAETPPYSGVTTNTLTIHPVTAAMEDDQYRCVATNTRGSATSNAALLAVRPLLRIAAVSAGENHSLFKCVRDSLWAVGDNSFGQLGDGSTVYGRTTPVPVMSQVGSFDAGSFYSLVGTSDGSLWCKGTGSWLVDTTSWPSPLGSDIIQADAGGKHVLFITSDHTLWAIGKHLYLPEDTYTSDPDVPIAVADNVIMASAANNYGGHSLFVTTEGELWSWGDNTVGQLGDGTTNPRSSPYQVAEGVLSASAGEDHSLFIKTDHTLWGIGYNNYGQLGDGTNEDRAVPVLIARDVARVAAGAFHTLFVKTDGSLWVTGDNGGGQLGDGTFVNRNTPVQVAQDVADVAGGAYHSLFVKTDGTLWAMGSNYDGQLGDGTRVDRNEPVQIFIADTSGPIIRAHPLTQEIQAGKKLTLTVAIEGDDPCTYQWRFNGVDIPGADEASYTLSCAQRFHAGSYEVLVTRGGESTCSAPAQITVAAPPPSSSHLLNLSTRGLAQTGDNVLIPGFVINGSQPKRLLIRAVGPTLTMRPFNLNPAQIAPDPQMTLKRLNTAVTPAVYVDVAINDNWGDNANAADITTTGARLFAFSLKDPRESALLVDLSPGQYTVIARDRNGESGIAIVELYDADPGNLENGSRLINISNRGFCGVGDEVMIPGFWVSSEGPKTFLIRVVGPRLATRPFNVAGTMADPKLTIFSGQTAILENDNWGDNPDAVYTAQIAAQLFAFALPSGSKDAAMVVTLPPGGYTVVGSSAVDGESGVVLVEVYAMP